MKFKMGQRYDFFGNHRGCTKISNKKSRSLRATFSILMRLDLRQERHLHHNGLDELVADLDEDFGVLLAEGLLHQGCADVLASRG